MKQRLQWIYLTLTAIVLLAVSSNLNWGKDFWKGLILADGKGYYSYLPAVFIYHDANLGFYDKIEKQDYYNPQNSYDYRSYVNNRYIPKYYIGTAVAISPFFLAAHAYATITNAPPDGYSKPYMIAVNLAGIFYLLAGLWFIYKLLQLYNIHSGVYFWLTLGLVFGTNLFYYSAVVPSMSHIYSFGFIAAFVYYAKLLTITYKPKTLVILGLLLGIIAITRPINVLVVLVIPFLAESPQNLFFTIKKIFSNIAALVLAVVGFAAVVFIQALYYKIATGSYWVYSYLDEGFNFAKPEIINILFSYRKGLFLYTPMYLLALLGVLVYVRKSPYKLATALGFFLVLTYFLSSWTCWWYGGSFSGRIYVDYLSFFALLLALLLSSLQSQPKALTSLKVLIVVLVVFCQIQIYQYRYYQIHWSDTTREQYWDNFLRLDKL